MSELYDYLLTVYKVLVGLVTTKRLIFVALMAFAFYVVWICVSLLFSFQRKFGKRCSKLSSFIRKNSMDSTNLQVVDLKIENISSGFYHGWKKFKASSGKPSDFINRRDALDVEVSGGVLNQGKTIMRAYITLTTVILALFNFAYLGSDSTITSYLIAESLVLPLVYFVIMKLFYFLYTSIKQQLYKQDIECFYELIGILDETFGEDVVTVPRMSMQMPTAVSFDEAVADEQPVLEGKTEELATEETVEEEVTQEESEEDSSLKTLDKYDVFKKKNIDVDKIINEVPHNAGTSLPYINVDSDYVIKDDDNLANVKIVTEEDNASSILGGMMQDRASLKKNNENFLDVEKEVAEIDENKLAEANSEKIAEKESEVAEEDPFGSLGQFEIAENAVQPAEESSEEVTSSEESAPEVESTEAKAVEEEKTPEVIVPEVVEENSPEEVSDEEKESIAVAVSNFKAKKSKLASGGVVIERNQPIARRERPVKYEEPEPVEEYYEEPQQTPEYPQVHDEIRQLDVNENTDSILNSIKSSAGGSYEQPYQGGYADPYAGQGYANPNQNYGYQGGYVQNNPGFGLPQNPYVGAQQAGYGAYQNNAYQQADYGMNQNPYAQGYDSYAGSEQNETFEEVEEDFVEEEVEEAPVVKKTTKKVRTKEEEPRPRNLRKKSEAKAVEETKTPAKTRGRPKKQEVSESMVIKNDKEFDEVLSRAEKLMRKSEEGLSASQSKRIEKELKMLMDAMNRYKENK